MTEILKEILREQDACRTGTLIASLRRHCGWAIAKRLIPTWGVRHIDIGTNLGWIDLRGVDMSGANLGSANLHGANLRKAGISRAGLGGDIGLKRQRRRK